MRLFAALLAPFGWLAAIYGVFLGFPVVSAVMGTWLLIEYSRIAKGSSSGEHATSIWVISLAFNLAGVVIVGLVAKSWGTALWAVWPVIASLLSAWGLSLEVNDARGVARRAC